LSGSINNHENPNTLPESETGGSDSSAPHTPPDSLDNDQGFTAAEIPLPDFNQDEPDDNEYKTPDIPFQTSAAYPPDITGLPTEPRQEEDAARSKKTSPGRVYKISTAEPDWSDLSLPSLEEDTPSEEQSEPTSNWRMVWAVVREVGETIILTLIIFFLIQTVIRNFRVVGTSMVDNLHDGQYLIIDKLSYNGFIVNSFGLGGPNRGDVVVFEPPNRPGEDYVKRVIGLPGETVEIKRGQVFINNKPLDEPFLPRTGTYSMSPRVVPEGEVFVLGDNRNNSNDSHNWGTLPIENIVGRAWVSYWPPEQWGRIPRDEPTQQATLWHFLNELVPSANAESK
jgi:signal peptidase I